MPGADVAFHPDLIAGVFRDALLAPAEDAGNVEFGQSWHLISVPVLGPDRVWIIGWAWPTSAGR